MTPPDGVPDLVRRWTAAGQRHDAAGGLLAKGSASMPMAPRRRAMGRRGDGDGGAPAGSPALNALIERMEASLARFASTVILAASSTRPTCTPPGPSPLSSRPVGSSTRSG
jgi:hypothetical protein